MRALEHELGTHGHGPLAEEVSRRTGLNPARCYQCGKCSAGCPMAEETTLRPHDVMRLVNSTSASSSWPRSRLWLCLTCETCTARCPNECDPARTIDALREIVGGGVAYAPAADPRVPQIVPRPGLAHRAHVRARPHGPVQAPQRRAARRRGRGTRHGARGQARASCRTRSRGSRRSARIFESVRAPRARRRT